MDPNLQTVTGEERKKIYDELADGLIAAMENGLILEDETQKSSEFILKQLDNVQTRKQLLTFLDTLATTWPAYLSICNKLRSEEIKETDQEKIKQIENTINTLTN